MTVHANIITNDKIYIPMRADERAYGMDVRCDLSDYKYKNHLILKSKFDTFYLDGKVKTYDDGLPDGGSVIIMPGKVVLVPLGFKVSLSTDNSSYYAAMKVYMRSGLSTKGLHLANGVGIVDEGYLNECMVILYNSSDIPHVITHQARIAQVEFVENEKVVIHNVTSFGDDSDRGGGMGSTGTK